MRFEFELPTKIYFGAGILDEALKKEEKLIKGNVLLVSTKSMEEVGILERVQRSIGELEYVDKIYVFTDITSNPKVDEVNKGIAYAIDNKTDIVVGLGGGSAIDAAKAIAAGTGANEKIDKYFFEGKVPGESTLPIVAIPTTAGTGSELSKSGILSCTEKKIKTGVRGSMLYPKAAIVDPELTYTVPLNITMETGFDVLAHAIESYISKASNYLTQALSLQAVKMAADSMRSLSEDLSNINAREKICYASMIMGINLGNASTALPHRMQYPIGALTDTGHARGLMALYPAWIKNTYAFSSKKFDRICEIISGKECNCKDDALEIFDSFMKATCGRVYLEDFGLAFEDSDKMAEMVTGNIALDPAGDKENILVSIYKDAFKNH